MEPFLTVAETQALLRLGRTKTLALIAEGKIDAVKIGATWRVLEASVEEYIAGLTEARHHATDESTAPAGEQSTAPASEHRP